jgi:hypothetical protein
MRRGYFYAGSSTRRPYVRASLYFPLIGDELVRIEFLVDTGADRTVLSPVEGRRLHLDYGLDLLSLPRGRSSRGVGGQMETRLIEATLTLDGFSKVMTLPIFEPPPTMPFPAWMPSLLGRDVIYDFDFFLSSRTESVLFLDAGEGDALNLPET